jgi:large subunit ribosomal protein L22
MKVDAKLNYLRIAPRKVRLVVDLIRGRKVSEAEDRLRFVKKRASKPVAKLLQSAVANAEHNFDLKKDNLYISEIKVDQGPTLKRWRARARGAANEIQKKTSHITIVLDEIEPGQEIKTGKKGKIKIVKKKEKPKAEISDSDKNKKNKESKKSKVKKGEKQKGKNIFRRKSI